MKLRLIDKRVSIKHKIGVEYKYILGSGGVAMKKTLIFFFAFMLLMVYSVQASGFGAVCLGEGLKEQERGSVLKNMGVPEKTPEALMTREDEEKYLSQVIPDMGPNSRTVTSAYVEALEPGSGIKVGVRNIEYVTPEMITACLATAGVKDVRVMVASPYSVSGNSGVAAAVKAYEKLTGVKISEEAVRTASHELVLEGMLGQKIGMQKALQFINELKKKAADKPGMDADRLLSTVTAQEKRFNMVLDAGDREMVVSLLKDLDSLHLKTDQMAAQQVNIEGFLNDLSKTAKKEGLLMRIINSIVLFFKNLFS
jgi:uncharacterized protein YpuA (DUF1002 family)